MKFLIKILSKIYNRSYVVYYIDNKSHKVKLKLSGDTINLIDAIPVVPGAVLFNLNAVHNLHFLKKKELASRIVAEIINNFKKYNIHLDLESIEEQLNKIKREEEEQ